MLSEKPPHRVEVDESVAGDLETRERDREETVERNATAIGFVRKRSVLAGLPTRLAG